jgi:hypothetical protein
MSYPQKSPVGAGLICKSSDTQQNYSITRHKKKAPPYANQIGEGQRLLVYFGGHDCWKLARSNNANGRNSVALPVGDNPESKSWECAEGRSVVCIELDDTGPGFRMAVVRTLAAYFAYEVALIPHDCNPQNAVFWGCV